MNGDSRRFYSRDGLHVQIYDDQTAFRSFQNLLTPEAQRRSLVCVRRHLASNGKAIINLFDPKYDLILPGRHESVQLPSPQ